MSRNKDIKFLHKVTGWSYKKCRAHMKANHWDLIKALPIGDILGQLPEIISNTMKVMSEAINLFASATRDFANQLIQAMNEATSKKVSDPFLEGTNIDQIVIDESLPEQIDSK